MVPLLLSTTHDNGLRWELFRKVLSMCQEAITEDRFDCFWEKLLKERVPTRRKETLCEGTLVLLDLTHGIDDKQASSENHFPWL